MTHPLWLRRTISMPGTVVIAFCLLALAPVVQSEPALTVYNQQFAVVRDTLSLDLKPGVNTVSDDNITAHLEPGSVILRDPTGKRSIRILEQSYRADPLSQGLLLSLNEGKTIPFSVQRGDHTETVMGRIVRSGYEPHSDAYSQYGYQYMQAQMQAASTEPIIEVNGQLQFGLPGQPQFPTLGDDTILKPELTWSLESDQPGPLQAELAYVTGGMSWKADYNLVSPEEGDNLDLVGWVTIDNECGKTFDQAHVKLMAGDLNKVQQNVANLPGVAGGFGAVSISPPPVTEKRFDEYHLYTLNNPVTLHDRETKQVEFVRAAAIPSRRIYVYDGALIDPNRYNDSDVENIRADSSYGTQVNPSVWVMREIQNSKASHLGLPLPAGRLRFYRTDADGQLEFTGENNIDHTPTDETLRIYTGAAFDLVGERTRTDYKIDNDHSRSDESFSIRLRNHKKEAVEIRAVEHLYRGDNWTITAKSDAYTKKDSHTIEFPVTVPPGGERVVTYTVHYTW